MPGFCLLNSLTRSWSTCLKPQSISQYCSVTAPGAGVSVGGGAVGFGVGPVAAAAVVAPVVAAVVAATVEGAVVAAVVAADCDVGVKVAGAPPQPARMNDARISRTREIRQREENMMWSFQFPNSVGCRYGVVQAYGPTKGLVGQQNGYQGMLQAHY